MKIIGRKPSTDLARFYLQIKKRYNIHLCLKTHVVSAYLCKFIETFHLYVQQDAIFGSRTSHGERGAANRTTWYVPLLCLLSFQLCS